MSEKLTQQLKQWGTGKQEEEVPEMFRNGIDDLLKNLPANVDRKSSYKKRILMSVGSIAAASSLVIGSGFVSPTMASVLSEVPLIGSFFEKSADPILVEVKDKGLVSAVEKSATDKGITLTFTDIFYDGTKLALAYHLDMAEDLPKHGAIEKDKGFPFTLKAKMNNEDISFMAGAEEKPVDGGNGEYAGMISMDVFAESKLTGPLTLNLVINEVHGHEGNWVFQIPIENQKVVASTTKFTPGTTASLEDIQAVVDEINFTPASSDVTITITAPKEVINDVDFMIYDEAKTLIGGMSGFGGVIEELDNGQATMKRTITLPKMEDVPEKLYIEMFKLRDLTGKTVESKGYNIALSNDHFPITLPVGGDNAIIVTGVEYKKDKTLLKFVVEGEPILQTQWMTLESENSRLEPLGPSPVRIGGTGSSMEFAKEFTAVTPGTPLQLITQIEENWSRESTFIEVNLK
ncbi:DUF4179 domain-containing protein [Pseudoneobacillus sp. C159]